MSIYGVFQISPKLPHIKNSFGLQKITTTNFNYLPKAASASPANFPEQVLEAQPKRKRQDIVGDDLQEPSLLADSDSCFCEFKGLQIHHKICAPNIMSEESSSDAKNIGFPMILLHGFGASVFSWNRVMKPLVNITGSKVVAFDRPAFGLTSRVDSINHSDEKPLNPYSVIFSVMATLYFIDFIASQKAILVGHSAGSIVAVDTYFEAPERVAALILVAPAIFAPRAKSKEVPQEEKDTSDSKNQLQFWKSLSKFAKYIMQSIINLVNRMRGMVTSLYKKALSAFLRSTIGLMLIRMIINRFGIQGIRTAWYDSNQVTDHVLQGYTKPLRVKGWDKALVEYTIALLTDSESESESKPPLAERLSQISCPVLIITGDNDRIVPAWNSERLSRAIPGSYLEIIKNCGHLPQEEKPQEFISIVDKFLQRVFLASEDQYQLAGT